MPTDPVGYVTFGGAGPGALPIISGHYSLSHGITPGAAHIEVIPPPVWPTVSGTLTFFFGALTLNFHDCKLDLASIRDEQGGHVVTLQVLDRRWKWKFVEIWGSYNKRNLDGSLNLRTAVTPDGIAASPAALAELCLKAMGEIGYEVGDMPQAGNPAVNWEPANPAQALASLADQFGCRVVLQLNGTVALRKTGVGGPLPGGGVVLDSAGVKPPERPDSLKVICGRTLFQCDFVLEAVGLDVDGQIKPIDKLSYKPLNGWGNVDVINFSDLNDGAVIANNNQSVDIQFLAKQCVFRWYRVELTSRGQGDNPPLTVPGFGAIDSLEQILPLHTQQVDSETGIDGQVRPKPALVFGVFGNFRGLANSEGTEIYTDPWHLIATEGIVVFHDPVFRYLNPPGGAIGEAHIVLRTACNVQDPDTNAWVHHEVEFDYPPPGYGTGPRLLKHDELVLKFLPTYDNKTNKVVKLDSNLVAVDAEANHYLAGADAEYRPVTRQDATYLGLLPINPDGAIQQVTWQVGPGGATTRASLNDEHSPYQPPYSERRFYEQAHGLESAKLVANEFLKEQRAEQQLGGKPLQV